MKIMTVLGTRPEIIRLSRVIERLDRLVDHVLVHTGQNFDPALRELFFSELGVRRPDHELDVRGDTSGERIAEILRVGDRVLRAERPDRLLILGDTDSGLTAILAKRMGIPVYHMEAGNRCYDDRVPEEVNRRVIDHASDVLLPYSERSRSNLLREGIAGERIFVTGNPIGEVLEHHAAEIGASDVLDRLALEPGRYVLVTMHRQENVDDAARLAALLRSLDAVAVEYAAPVIVSTHPRTRERLRRGGVDPDGGRIRFLDPFGFFDFVALERAALVVLTDSGTVQEECCIFGVANVTLRDTTERPETMERGSSILAGVEPEAVLRAIRVALDRPIPWTPPPEYLAHGVSQTVCKILLGFHAASP